MMVMVLTMTKNDDIRCDCEQQHINIGVSGVQNPTTIKNNYM